MHYWSVDNYSSLWCEQWHGKRWGVVYRGCEIRNSQCKMSIATLHDIVQWRKACNEALATKHWVRTGIERKGRPFARWDGYLLVLTSQKSPSWICPLVIIIIIKIELVDTKLFLNNKGCLNEQKHEGCFSSHGCCGNNGLSAAYYHHLRLMEGLYHKGLRLHKERKHSFENFLYNDHKVASNKGNALGNGNLYLLIFCYFAIILAKDCGPLSVPMNGSSSGHETTFPNTISFSCDLGFVMIGSQTRKCLSNGHWSGNETSCTGSCSYFVSLPFNIAFCVVQSSPHAQYIIRLKY